MNVETDIESLILSLTSILDPQTSNSLRRSAHEALEIFKDNSSNLIPCAIALTDTKYPAAIRHFGLQLIEHAIKDRWNKIPVEDKILVKNMAADLMQKGLSDICVEEKFIKDGLCKIYVEMAKREWPQQWTDMLDEMTGYSQWGSCQIEVVLMFYLRFAEDVVTFQCLPTARRRDILVALTSNMAAIFDFFTSTLQKAVTVYQSSAAEFKGHEESKLIALSVLTTLQSYVDWVAIEYVIKTDLLLIQMLVLLLKEKELQNTAIEVLLLVATRRGKLEHRKSLMVLLYRDALINIIEAAQAASQVIDERCYIFLKRLCEYLVALTQQMMLLWDTPEEKAQRMNLDLLMEALFAFSQHPAQSVSSMTLTLWSSLLNHEHIGQQPVVLTIVPQLAKLLKTTILRIGNPLLNNHISWQYYKFEAEEPDEFNQFATKYRSEACTLLKRLSTINVQVTYDVVSQWLKDILQEPINSGLDTCALCNYNSPSYISWDGFGCYLDAVMTRVFQLNQSDPLYQSTPRFLQSILQYHVDDAVIMVTILDCILNTIEAVNVKPELLKPTLDKIFSLALYGQHDPERSKAVMHLRREACVTFVRIAKYHPKILLPLFDDIVTHVRGFVTSPIQESEKNAVYEGLYHLSNEFNHYERQKQFIEELLKDLIERWNNEEMKGGIQSVDHFLDFIGASKDPDDLVGAELAGTHRSLIVSSKNVILSLMKAINVPTEQQVLVDGGFINNNEVLNPCGTTISLTLDMILILIRTMNACMIPSNLSKVHPSLQGSYDLPASEIAVLLGKYHDPGNIHLPAQKTTTQRLQTFMFNVFEDCCQILGMAGIVLGHNLYKAPNLPTSLMNSVFTNVDYMPDNRLRTVIRVFLKPFVIHCPSMYYKTSVLRVIAAICPYMLERITKSWKNYQETIQAEDYEEDDDTNKQQIVDEIHLRLLTRDYANFINHLVISKNSTNGHKTTDDDVSSDKKKPPCDLQPYVLSELGAVILGWDNIFPPVLLSAFNTLIWLDGPTCISNIHVCHVLIKQLISDNKLNQQDCFHVLNLILNGIQNHGQDDASLSQILTLAVTVYELMRPKIPELRSVLEQIPGADITEIKMFEGKFLSESGRNATIKAKKAMFKKVIQPIIPVNVGQRHKRDITIKNLAPILQKSRPKRKALVEIIGDEDIGLCNLFNSL